MEQCMGTRYNSDVTNNCDSGNAIATQEIQKLETAVTLVNSDVNAEIVLRSKTTATLVNSDVNAEIVIRSKTAATLVNSDVAWNLIVNIRNRSLTKELVL
ncbi:hypothetical protein F511_17887 [Dorcoceras hygrometricum]|uniref:Uncharacterized protein n=1 Tax=Dorcoceras hygrometricum TaxID=472368 RepID=A0A2Z7AIT5_9LAMI|nr:hypothetical protein F511_17887 [Dorcoceras hygrometricum]